MKFENNLRKIKNMNFITITLDSSYLSSPCKNILRRSMKISFVKVKMFENIHIKS